MASLDLDGPLWRFAVRLYSLPAVAPACLKLQDEGSVDVLMLLAALYAEIGLRAPLRQQELAALAGATGAWRSRAITPLRTLRIALKPSCPAVPDALKAALRNQVKALELQAERIQLAVIAQWLDQRVPAASAGEPLQLAWLVGDTRPTHGLADAFELVATAARTQ